MKEICFRSLTWRMAGSFLLFSFFLIQEIRISSNTYLPALWRRQHRYTQVLFTMPEEISFVPAEGHAPPEKRRNILSSSRHDDIVRARACL